MSRDKFDEVKIQAMAELCINLEDARTTSLDTGDIVQVCFIADVKNGGIFSLKVGSTKKISNIRNFLDNSPLTG